MQNLSSILTASVGRKILNGLTGLFLCLFILAHLLGNLLIVFDPEGFNLYANRLTSLGEILYIIEAGLALVILIHAVTAVSVWIDKQRARPHGYAKSRGAGSPSRKSISSTTMIYTGVFLAAFLVWHIGMMRFGPHYPTQHGGLEIRDLYRLVVEAFGKPYQVVLYEIIMVMIGFHLRHGFWSAFQSVGLNHPKYSPFIYVVGIVFAVAAAAGFLVIPPYIYFTGGAL